MLAQGPKSQHMDKEMGRNSSLTLAPPQSSSLHHDSRGHGEAAAEPQTRSLLRQAVMAGGRISRKKKGKGKEKMNDPPPPPPPPPRNVEVFQLNTATITAEIAQAMLPGTYCTLLEDIRLGATNRSTDSKEGKPVLPRSGEYFVV